MTSSSSRGYQREADERDTSGQVVALPPPEVTYPAPMTVHVHILEKKISISCGAGKYMKMSHYLSILSYLIFSSVYIYRYSYMLLIFLSILNKNG